MNNSGVFWVQFVYLNDSKLHTWLELRPEKLKTHLIVKKALPIEIPIVLKNSDLSNSLRIHKPLKFILSLLVRKNRWHFQLFWCKFRSSIQLTKAASFTSDNFSKIISINLVIIFFFRMSWWHTHLLEFPTGHRATPTSTWPSATWCGAPSCCARPRSATRWTTSWPPTSRSCSPTWTSRSHWGSSENYVQ